MGMGIKPNHNPHAFEVELVYKKFSDVTNFLNFVRTVTQRGAKIPRLLLFPEGLLGNTAISRQEGKRLAEWLNITIAGKNTYLFYSVFERSNKLRFSNNGYIVEPKIPSPTARAYKVYPKLATYNAGGNPTDFDVEVARQNGADESYAKNVFRAGKKVRAFPRVNINGAVVEFRVCADSRKQFTQDVIRARSNSVPANLILISAMKLPIYLDEFAPLWSEIAPKGMAIINDLVKGSRILKKLPGNGDFRITVLKERHARQGKKYFGYTRSVIRVNPWVHTATPQPQSVEQLKLALGNGEAITHDAAMRARRPVKRILSYRPLFKVRRFGK